MNRVSFLITITQPPDVSEEDLIDHIRFAIQTEGGQLNPNNPLFGEAVHPVEVKPFEPNKPNKLSKLNNTKTHTFNCSECNNESIIGTFYLYSQLVTLEPCFICGTQAYKDNHEPLNKFP